MSPRLLNLPLLLLANKQDVPGSLSVEEIRESFEAWTRAQSSRETDTSGRHGETDGAGQAKGKGKGKERAEPPGPGGEGSSAAADGDMPTTPLLNDDGARDARVASLDVMGASALEGCVRGLSA